MTNEKMEEFKLGDGEFVEVSLIFLGSKLFSSGDCGGEIRT